MSNESKRGASSNSRVYKSTDVHKRRTTSAGRADKPSFFSKFAGGKGDGADGKPAIDVPEVVQDESAAAAGAAEAVEAAGAAEVAETAEFAVVDEGANSAKAAQAGVDGARAAALQGAIPEVTPAAQETAALGSVPQVQNLPQVQPPVSAAQAALRAAVPAVNADEQLEAPGAAGAKPADEIAKAAEEIAIDDTIDRQTFSSMPTTRLQAIGDFVTRKTQEVTGGSADASSAAGGADGDGTLMDHPAFSRQAGGPGVSQIDPGKPNDDAARRRRTVVAATAVIAVIVVAAIAIFAWNRWGRFDDRVDIQGQWYVVGTTVPVQIDESSIKLTDDVAYEYVIDQNEKTVQYRFGTMEGQGRYWFSDDRQYLVITDGDNYSSASTTVEDLVRTFTELTATMTGQEIKLPEGDGIIAFSREADPKAQAAKDQAAQKAKEEQEKQEAAAAASDESADASASSASAASTTDDEESDEYYDDEYYYDEEYDDSTVDDSIVDDESGDETGDESDDESTEGEDYSEEEVDGESDEYYEEEQ